MTLDGYDSRPRMCDVHKNVASLAARRKSYVRTWRWYIQNDVSEESALHDGQAIPYTESYVTDNSGRSKSVFHSKDILTSLPSYDHRWLNTRRHASYYPIRYARNGIFYSQPVLSGRLLW